MSFSDLGRRCPAMLGALLAVAALVACSPAASPAGPPPAAAPAAAPQPPLPALASPSPSPRAEASPAAALSPGARTLVRVGGSGGVIDRALFVGAEKGFFDEQGIDLDVQVFPTAVNMIPLLATGRLDAIHGGSYPAIFNAVTAGVDLKIVAGVSVLRPPGPGIKNSNWIIVRKELGDQIRGVGDLRGRKVAVHARGSSGEQLLERALATQGLTLNDVQVEGVTFPDQLAALSSGVIDAAVAIEPFISLAETRAIATPLFDSANAMPNYTVQWLYYGADFIRERPEVGKRFMLAYLKAIRYIEDAWLKGTNREEIVQLFVKNTPVKDAQLYDRMGITYGEPNGAINLQSIADDQDFFERQGALKQKVEASRLVDPSFGQYALQALGRYRE